MLAIDIFGIMEEYPSKEGGCGSINGCNIHLTIGDQYDSLVIFLKKKNLFNKVNLNFIDIREIDKNDNKEIARMIDVGFSIPYIFINGKIRFFGTIPKEEILSEIISSLY